MRSKIANHLHNLSLPIISFSLIFSCIKDPEPLLLQTTRPELLPKGTISGFIMDFQGDPVSGVQVVATGGYSGVSHNDGSFIVDELPKGDYLLSFMRYGYLDTTLYIDNLGINADRTLSDNLFLRNSLVNITGKIITPDGKPVPNATVSLIKHPFTAKTDRDGIFTIKRVTPDVNRLLAAHDTEGWGQTTLQLAAGIDLNTTVILYHKRTGTIKGTVFKSDNTPDSGAIVSAAGGAYRDTAKDGRFLLENVPCAIPLSISSEPSRLISDILIPESNPTLEIDLKVLNTLQKRDLTILERQIFTLTDDSVTIFADIRYKNDIASGYNHVSAFLWNITTNDTSFDTCTSVPYLQVKPMSGSTYRFGAITLSGDTLCCMPVSKIEKTLPSKITFEKNSFHPVNVTVKGSDSVMLSWKAIDSGGRPLEYSVLFGGSNTNPPSLYRSDIVDTFLYVRPQEGWVEKSYLWQIEARSSKNSIRSEVNFFTYDSSANINTETLRIF
ncbi:MAG: carboxypeptidase regulatory-like domain-containing protein [Fibrobacter sp.]|nr:carboxypeptidase regulatory-like domain-containing protein [Fibrobacter sp.]